MSKNIYEQLGFQKADEYIFSEKIINEGQDIFHSFPLSLIGIRPLLVEQTVFEETIAISTAEDSELTPAVAKEIQISEEQEARILKYKQKNKLSEREKYDQLEFENIKAIETRINKISFEDITVDFICNLHHDLTIGLDNYSESLGVSHYHSGELRKSDSVRVGRVRKYSPPKKKEIRPLLKLLLKYFSSKKKITLYDILEFHILFYAIHPFQNGNKRVARILESLLLDNYGYGMDRTLSLAIYYKEERGACNLFLMESILRKDVSPFVNFAIRGYFQAGQRLFTESLDLYLHIFYGNFKKYIKENIKEIHKKNYEKAVKAILELRGVFTHTEFMDQMKKQHCTSGVSQSIIQDLLERNILRKKSSTYFYGESLDIRTSLEKLTAFFLQYNIQI